MKYDININYNDKYNKTEPNDFRLDVRVSFDDEAAPFVAEILKHFYANYVAEKDEAQKKAEKV